MINAETVRQSDTEIIENLLSEQMRLIDGWSREVNDL